MRILSYLFWPNPPLVEYTDPKVLLLLGICGVLLLAGIGVRLWRSRGRDPVLLRLSRSWSSTLFAFAVTGLVLVIARTEGIQYVSMRIWWFVWGLALLGYVLFQGRQFQVRYYRVLPREPRADERSAYLPRQKKRKRKKRR